MAKHLEDCIALLRTVYFGCIRKSRN